MHMLERLKVHTLMPKNYLYQDLKIDVLSRSRSSSNVNELKIFYKEKFVNI